MGLRNEELPGKLTPLFLLVLIVCLIPLDGLAASDDVVINEIVYDPAGDEASGEWIELYNQSTSGSVDIGGWAITDQDTHDYLIPDGTSIPADGYIVIHTGSGTDTSTDLYAGFTTGIWNNSGDEVLLEDASGNGIDYIEYDGGSGDSPPSGVNWSGSISGAAEGESLALIPNGDDQNNADNWIPRSGSYITQGASNAKQPDPTLSININYPSGKDYVSTCEEATAMIEVTNNDPAASIEDVLVEATLPSDYYYVSDNKGGSYDSSNHTVTWNGGISISADNTWSTTLTFKPNCSAASNQRIKLSTDWAPYVGGSTSTVSPLSSDPITVNQVSLEITKSGYNQSEGEGEADASSVVEASVGDTVVFLVEVENYGDGDAVVGATVEDVLGSGLSLNSITDDSDNTVSYTGSGTDSDPYTWTTDPISAGGTATFKVSATVDSCSGLENEVSYSWGCSDADSASCNNTGSDSASIELILKEPDVSYSISPSPIDINYCTGANVTIVVKNGNPPPDDPDTTVGPARGYTITMSGLPTSYSVSNVTGATYYANDNEFDAGDISPNQEKSFSFDLEVSSCDPQASGDLLFESHYTNDCGKDYYPPTRLDSFSLSDVPSISVSKSGQRPVDVGEKRISYPLEFNYEGTQTKSLTIVDDYPDTEESGNDYGDFTVSNAAGGTVSGGEIEWTKSFTDGETWTKTIQLDAPTNACAAGNTYTNQLSFSPTDQQDCNNCDIDNNSPTGFQIYVNNNDENAIMDHSKSVDYLNVNSNNVTTTGAGSAEDGTQIKYTTTVQFNGGSAPTTWDGILFTEDMDGGQTYVSVDSVKVNGDSYSNYTLNSTSGTLEIDLSGLDDGGAPAPNTGADLTLVYKLKAPDDSEGSFVDWSHLEVPGYPKDCGDDPTYDQGVDVSISETSLGASVSGPSLIDKCGTETYTINVSKNSPFQAYDALVTLNTNGNYDYVTGSVSFNGLEDEDGNTISTFDPTIDGDQLKWNLGDLSSGGTIEVVLKKECSPTDTDLTSTVGYNDNPDNVDPDSAADSQLSSRENTNTGSYTASALREGELDVVVQPETYSVRIGYPKFRVYVINRGDGSLYDVDMDLDFGTDLEYYDHSVSGVGITSFNPGSSSDGFVEWTYEEIPPGKKSVVTLTGELTGCSPDTVTATGNWCTICSLSSSDTMDISISASDVVVVSHFMEPPVMDYCGDTATFTMEAKNFGKTSVYQAQIQADLADGLSLNGNFTPEYSTDGGTTWSYFPGDYTAQSGNDYTWDFADPDGDGDKSDALLSTTDRAGNPVLASGETISIRYEARIADCTAASSFEGGNKTTTALSNFDRPCNHTNTGAPGSSSDPNNLTVEGAEPHVSITKQGRNDTKGTNYTAGTVEAESGNTVKWKIEITNDGNYRAKNVVVEDVLPDNVSYDSWSQLSGVNLIKTGNYTWEIDRTDSYLEDEESATFTVTTTVDSCTDSNTTNESTVSWGCCSTVDEDSESNSVDLKTQLNPVDVDVSVDKSGCTTCGGKVTVNVSNTTTEVLSLYDLDMQEDLPTGYVYDDSKTWNGDTGTKVTFSGWSGRTDQGLTWSDSENEPVKSSGTLTWASVNNGGNIPNNKALLGPGETITIEFYIKNDGTSGYVDNDTNTSTEPNTNTGDRNDNDPADPDYDVPSISNTFDVSGDDSCGNPVGTSSGSDSVDPAQPDVDVTVIPDKPLVTSGDMVTWTVTLSNDGSADASNISLELDPGPDGSSSGGYSSTDVTQNAPSGYTIGDDPISWSPSDIGTLAPGDTYVIKLEGTVGSSGGDLSVTADLDGECTDASGSNTGHKYTIDYTKNYVAGLTHDKTFKNVNEPGSINNEDTDATSSIGNVVTYEISLEFLSSGAYSNVSLTDDLDDSETGSTNTRVEYMSGSFTAGSGNISNNNDGTITIEPGEGSFTVSGSKNFVIQVKVRVKDISSVQGSEPAASPSVITDESDLSFEFGGRSYSSSNSDYKDLLLEDNTDLTIVEPYVSDSNFELSSVSPSCGSQVTENETIDYSVTFKNTGNGPLYDSVYRHEIDAGMRDNSATNIVVSVDDGAGNDRTLDQATDYTVSKNTPTDDQLELTFHNTNDAAIAPGETVTVSYTLTVDGGIGAGVELDDVIKLDEYTSLPGDGTVAEEAGGERVSGFSNTSPGYPLSALNCQHTTAGLSASKSVQSDVTSPTAEQTSPDTDPGGGTTSALTIGEQVIYRISTTVPAGTTAYDMTFSDTVGDGYTVTDIQYDKGNGFQAATVPGENADGTTTVNLDESQLGDISGGSGGQQVTVKITARVDKTFTGSHDGANYPPDGTDWSDDHNDNGDVDAGDHLANRGTYSWSKTDGGSKTDVNSNTTDTVIEEPELSNLGKSIGAHYDSDGTTEVNRGVNTFYWYDGGSQKSTSNVPVVLPNDELVFELTVDNTGSTTAYDINLQDQLPPGLTYQDDTLSVSATSGSPTITTSNPEPSNFTVDELDAGATLSVTYMVKVDTGLGAGQYLENSATVENYSTLPSGNPNESHERDTDTANGYSDLGPVSSPVGVQYPTLSKNLYRYRDYQGRSSVTQINGGDVRIGERLRYEVVITLPRKTKLYEGSGGHVIVEDQLPEGFSRIDGNDTLNSGNIALTLDGQTPNPSGPGSGTTETWNWYFETVTNSADSSSTAALQFDVRVTDENNQAAQIYGDNSTAVDVVNDAILYWDTAASGEEAKDDPSLNTSQTATVTQPDLSLNKSVTPASGSVVTAGDSVSYTVEISNDGQGIAYEVGLSDILPAGIRTGFSLDSVEITDGSGATQRSLSSGEDFTESYDGATGELNIATRYDGTNDDYDSRVEPGESLVINYSTTVDSDIGAGRVGSRALVNEANIPSYYSFRSGVDGGERKEYGPVGPKRTKLTTPVPDLGKEQDPSPESTVEDGDSLTYTITAPEDAVDVTLYSPRVEDTVPDGLSLDSVSVSGGTNSSVTTSGRDFVVDFDEIGANNQATVTVNCTVNSIFDDGGSIQPGHEFVNDARVEWYDAPDSDPERRRKIVSSNEVSAYYQGAVIKLVPGHTSEAFPGGTVNYRHNLSNIGNESGAVTINYGPSTRDWNWILYKGDGNGNIDTGPGPIEDGDTVSLSPGATQELIARAFVPADAPTGSQDVLKIEAQGSNNSASVTDITIVRKGKMDLTKELKVDGGSWTTDAEGQPGDTVIYRLTYKNISAIDLSNVRVIDSLPDHTIYKSSTAGSDNQGSYSIEYSIDGGVSWRTSEPSDLKTLTHIKWTYNDAPLLPGETGYVTYEVEIQ